MKFETKYQLGQEVYVYTPQGLLLMPINEVFITWDNAGAREYYRFEKYGVLYGVDEIQATTLEAAKKVLKKASNELQLKLLY